MRANRLFLYFFCSFLDSVETKYTWPMFNDATLKRCCLLLIITNGLAYHGLMGSKRKTTNEQLHLCFHFPYAHHLYNRRRIQFKLKSFECFDAK